MSQSFDLVVVGGGPGGYVAAIRSAQLGLKTALVERKHLGGICLNWGCIPTKALLKGAEVAHTLSTADQFGFSVSGYDFDIEKLVGHSRAVADRLSGGVAYLMQKHDVTVFEGDAKLSCDGELSVSLNAGGKEKLHADHIILATGARPRALPAIKPDGKHIWTYFEAMVPSSTPESILVVGSGAIGTEFASFYRDLGVEVTLVELADRLLPAEDKDVSAFAQKAFKSNGMKVKTSTNVSKVKVAQGRVTCTLETPTGETEELTVDKVILAAGIQGNIENIGLEDQGVATDRGFITVDEWGRTSVDGVYAIGDVSGPPCLAHKASHEGVVCVEKIAGVPGVHPVDRSKIPGCTYCRPQIASVGMTEAEAKQAGFTPNVGTFDLRFNGKALAIGEGEGFVKTVFDAHSGELLGAHMIGPEVTEMVQGFGVAQSLEMTAEELAHTVFSHPTVSEAMHEAVLDSLGRVLHQ